MSIIVIKIVYKNDLNKIFFLLSNYLNYFLNINFCIFSDCNLIFIADYFQNKKIHQTAFDQLYNSRSALGLFQII